MKRTKIDALKVRAASKASAIAKAEEERNNLELRLDQLKEKAAEAASAGDFDRYQGLSSDAETVSKQLLVKNSFLDALDSNKVSNAEILSAWAEYASDCDKQFDKLFADYEAKRKALFASYSALIELQGEAITTQNELLKAVGINDYREVLDWKNRLEHKLLPTGHPQLGEIRMNGINYTNPDLLFFLLNYEKEYGVHFASVLRQDSDASKVLAILGNRSF